MNLPGAAWIAGGLAVASLVAGTLAFAVPVRVQGWLRAFPRSRSAGVVLSLAALLGAAVELHRMPMGMLESWKPSLLVLIPLVFILVVVFMDDLLAPRALGGILALAATPILETVRWHPSSGRLVLVVLAYLMAGIGCYWMLSPYGFRKMVESTCKTAAAIRYWGIVKIFASIGLFMLGWHLSISF
ncbi:MAG: hypothetical protein A2498_05855 [Lentisphaerae bacterium RIFOXYC12_FULL_60_16]|nr:MAG: hypothetical protein A2498_05855 [Lentisphaerae bacterium RIFOXYC12_FULL_60_16]OGV82547.1 MAG: hypothetical protein A2340_10915 [Lentisphaerae bacterium RIFOXYB12_FULL_60_10]